MIHLDPSVSRLMACHRCLVARSCVEPLRNHRNAA